MLIYWNGHSEFLLESEDGYRVLTDPFDPATGYPMRDIQADAVITSHGHGDHNYVHKVLGSPMVISNTGETVLTPRVRVSSVLADHDGEHGAKRGKTLLTVIEMDGLRIAHLGDLGCLPDDGQKRFLRGIDILMLPIGGYFTVDGETAAQIVRELRPTVTLPMHYKTRYNSTWPITDEKPFLTALNVQAPPVVPLLRVTREDISCMSPVYMFELPQG